MKSASPKTLLATAITALAFVPMISRAQYACYPRVTTPNSPVTAGQYTLSGNDEWALANSAYSAIQVYNANILELQQSLANLGSSCSSIEGKYPTQLGANWVPDLANNAPAVNLMKSANLTLARVSQNWEQASDVNGNIISGTTAGFAGYINSYLDNGITPVAGLTSNWVNPGDPTSAACTVDSQCNSPYNYANRTAAYQAYATFASNMVATYPQVTYWELWNEMDSGFTVLFGATQNGSSTVSYYQRGENYAAMLAVVVPKMKAANSGIKIVLGGLAVDQPDFLLGVLAGGGGQYLDVINVHAYTYPGNCSNPGPPSYVSVVNFGVMARYIMDGNGLASKPLWLTEFGMSSNVSQWTLANLSSPANCGLTNLTVDAGQWFDNYQADDISNSILANTAYGIYDAMIVYSYGTQSGTMCGNCSGAINPSQYGQGIVSPVDQVTPKPAMQWLMCMNGGTASQCAPTNVAPPLTPDSDFDIDATLDSTTVSGGSVTYTFTVGLASRNYFTGTVNLTVGNLPSGATANFSPTASLSGVGRAILTISANSSVSPGTYNVTITGTSGSSNHSITVTVTVPGTTLPSGWTDNNIGSASGSAAYGAGVFTINGEGSDIWGNSDQFNYASLPAIMPSGSNVMTVSARVTGQQNTNAWAKSGLMIRTTTASNSPYVAIYVTPGNGIIMEYRSSSGGTAIDVTPHPTFNNSFPLWLRLAVNSQGVFTGYYSSDGATWTQYDNTTISVTMTGDVNAGLAVCSHDTSMLNTTTFDNVSIPPPFSVTAGALSATAGGTATSTVSVNGANGYDESVLLSACGIPAGASVSFSPSSVSGSGSSTMSVVTSNSTPGGTFNVPVTGNSAIGGSSQTASLTVCPLTTDGDIGKPPTAGSTAISSGVYTINSYGEDVWGQTDQFHYYSMPSSGDMTVTARVVSQTNLGDQGWAKAGVMMRDTTASDAEFVFVMVTPQNGVDMMYRSSPDTNAVRMAQTLGLVAPYWVRLVRTGNAFTGFASPDGVTWTQLGTITVPMPTNITAGLAVTSHNNTEVETSVFDNVSIPGSIPSPSGCPQ